MMNDVAHMVVQDHFWTICAVALMLGYCVISIILTFRYIVGGDVGNFGLRLRRRGRLCLDQTGYVGALIARHTVLVTANVLALNLSLNLLSVIGAMDDRSNANMLIQAGLHGLAGVCIVTVVVIAAITFALCNEIASQAENDR